MTISVSACATGVSGEASCSTGAYSNGKHSVVLYDATRDTGPRQTGYTFVDGRRGILGNATSELDCVSGSLIAGSAPPHKRIPLEERDVSFKSHGLALAGRLITPVREDGAIRPLAVFVHGSESTATVGRSRYPYLLAAQGVSVFVYDKRGTGQSEGSYTQDFQLLADDASAAFRTARKMAGASHDRIGFFGGSQGGWVAPLAATQTPADFLVVGFGLVLSPAEEDAEQVFDEMRRAGYGPADLAKARDITDATGEIVASHFANGIETLQTLKAKYHDEPWLGQIEGEFTGDVLNAPEEDLRAGHAGEFEDDNVAWRYDAMAVLQSLSIPQLWVLADSDRAAPGRLTQERLAELQQQGMPIITALFPNTDHGMVEFDIAADGSRRYTRFADGYFRLIADNMKGTVTPPYGKATLVAQAKE